MATTQKTTTTTKGDPQTPRQATHTSATYRLPNKYKPLIASIADPQMRGHYRRMLIDADVTAAKHAIEAAKKKDKKSAAEVN